jgi:hypothetical protein
MTIKFMQSTDVDKNEMLITIDLLRYIYKNKNKTLLNN